MVRPYMTMLTAWVVLLSRLSGQQEVVVGTPVANRSRTEIEGLIGFFVNTLALRLDLAGSPTMSEMLQRVKSQALAAQQNQDIPFEQVVEIMQPVRSLGHSPLFQVMFNWQTAEATASAELPGLKRRPSVSVPHVFAKFDLTLSLTDTGQSVRGAMEYATSLFEAGTIQRYLGHFRTLLESMVASDIQTVDRVALLSPGERHQLLYGWNHTGAEYPRDKCVHELFEEQVERDPDAVAVVFEDTCSATGS